MAIRLYSVVSVFLYAAVVTAQSDVTATCGNEQRNTVIPDNVFNDAKVRENIFPGIRHTLCDFTDEGFCHLEGKECKFEANLFNAGDKIAFTLIKRSTTTPGDGQTAQLAPCTELMVRM